MSIFDVFTGGSDEGDTEDEGGGLIGDAIGDFAEDFRVRTIQELPFHGVLWEFVAPDGEAAGNYNLTPQGRTAALIAGAALAYFLMGRK